MKSARPKVLHQVAGAADDRLRARHGRRARRRDAHRGGRPRSRTGAGGAGRSRGPPVRPAGAAAGNRPRRAAGGRCSRASRGRWSCCRATCRCCRSTRCARCSRATRRRAPPPPSSPPSSTNPYGYGRILRDGDAVTGIVEQRDATPAEREIREINSGIYAFDLEPLFPSLAEIASNNAQQEFYLTDLVAIAAARGGGCRRWSSTARRRFSASTAAPSWRP